MAEKETFTGELAKQLPIKDIYNDVAHPTLSTVGLALQGVTRVALAPISALVWGYDKIAEYLDEAVPQYFEKRKIEKEKIKSPDPAVAVPLIEAMRYTSHKPELRDMFVNLLGASMNEDCVDEHPAFVEIIKQLSPDECKMLKYLYDKQVMPMLKMRIRFGDNPGEMDITPYMSDICDVTKCQYPHKFPEYLDNLHRLGLVTIYYDRHLTDDESYLKLKKSQGSMWPNTEDFHIVEQKSMYIISELGKKFCRVCVE